MFYVTINQYKNGTVVSEEEASYTTWQEAMEAFDETDPAAIFADELAVSSPAMMKGRRYEVELWQDARDGLDRMELIDSRDYSDEEDRVWRMNGEGWYRFGSTGHGRFEEACWCERREDFAGLWHAGKRHASGVFEPVCFLQFLGVDEDPDL